MKRALIIILFPLIAIGVRGTGVKSLSVMVGDSVTLYTDVPDIQKYDVIQWRFAQQKSPIAEINRTAVIFKTYDGPDGRFRDRLQLDQQTGSLTIMKTETNHSGRYEVEISSSSEHTTHKTFNVTVSGEIMTVLVIEGDSVTPHTDTKKMDKDLIERMFGDTVLANISEGHFSAYGGPDGKFRDFRDKNVTAGQTIADSVLSSGWLAGIVVFVVVVFVVGAAVTVYCGWCKLLFCWW